MNINISLWNTIKICSAIVLTKLIWDGSTVLKEYLIDKENLYKISRSIEDCDQTELPDEMGEIKEELVENQTERSDTSLNKIGF